MLKILTVCYNTANFVSYLYENITNTCAYPFTMTVVDNGSKLENKSILEKMQKENKINLRCREQEDIYAPSRHHGEAIHHGLECMNDNDNVVIVDCDSVFLEKEWGSKIESLISSFDHITCKRPTTKNGCGAWFSAFKMKTILDNNISFMPMLNPDGSDKKRSDRYDVGSDLIRLNKWKPIIAHKKIKFHKQGHIWLLDERPFIDHMGKCRSIKDMENWKKWLDKNWNIK